MSSDFDRDEDEKELIPAEEAPRELEEVEYHAGGDRSRTGRKRKSSTPRDRSGRCKLTCSHLVCTVVAVLVALVLSMAVGLFVGQSLGRKASEDSQPTVPPSLPVKVPWGDAVMIGGQALNVSDYFADHISEDDIKKYLFNLTRLPHIAGSDRNKELALMIHDEWKQYGFDSVDLFNYTVLLSYPNASNPNSLTLKDFDGQLLYQSHIAQEPPLTPGEDNPDVAPPFNAYSGNGTVTGPLVYVNYGRLRDYQYLMNISHNLNLTGHICIVRYGKLFRGDKAHLAQRFGCEGLLIYSDPQDYVPEGIPVYPDGLSLPEYGVQRGSLQISDGDVLTPGIPALPGMNRRAYSKAQAEGAVPHIPVQPISYGDATHFMSQLSEVTPPDEWMGGLQVEYKIFQAEENDNYTELVVNSYQVKKEIHNVVAKLYGAVEPDRQVILGNHRDAWVFGAVDPNSGTASLMSLAKVIGQLRKDSSWRPGRTIVLCSWDAEEYGLIGSTEWVEDYGKILGTNTMAYLNVDVAVSGQEYVSAYSSPILYEVIWRAAAMVKCPNVSFPSVYDEWLAHTPGSYNGITRPKIGNLGSGTDYTPMIQLQGISSSDINYEGHYPVYHSVHDNFYWMSHFGDPSFSHHRAIATMWMSAALLLTTTPLPPIDPRHYSQLLVREATDLEAKYKDVLAGQSISIDFMMQSVHELESAFLSFQGMLDNLKASTNISEQFNVVRIVNNILMNVERAFIHPEGLPGRSYYKHVIFAPSSINSYDSTVFPGLSDAITNAIEFEGSWEEVKSQLDIVIMHLRYATQTIEDPSLQHALHHV